MAIALVDQDIFTTSTPGTGGTHSFTVSSGTNRALIVFVQATDSGGAGFTTTVTYDGVTVSPFDTGGAFDGTSCFAYYLAAPNTGANNLVVSFDTTIEAYAVTALCYTGVKQTIDSSKSGSELIISATSASDTGTAQTNSQIITGIALQDGGNGPFSASNGETELYDGQTGAGTAKEDITYWVAHKSASGAFTTGATWSVSNRGYQTYVEIEEATASTRRIFTIT